MSNDIQPGVRIRCRDVQEATAAAFDVPVTTMRTPYGSDLHTFARHVAMTLALDMTGRTQTEVAAHFCCEHTTVRYAELKIRPLLGVPELARIAARIRLEAGLRAIDFHALMRAAAAETLARMEALQKFKEPA